MLSAQEARGVFINMWSELRNLFLARHSSIAAQEKKNESIDFLMK